jgi:hypothetical protein
VSTPAPRRNTGHNGQGNAGHNGQGNAGHNGQGKQQGRRPDARPAELKPADFWRIPPKAATPPPITRAADPTALLRSLGRPPLDQNGADRYLAAVAERAAGLATALAVAAGIFANREED